MAMIVEAVTLLHERGYEGVRIRSNFYATGHWRCRVSVPRPGSDPRLEGDHVLAYTNGRWLDVFGDGRVDWDAASIADELERRVSAFADARRADAAYAAWLRDVRERTEGGSLSFYEDFLSEEDDYEARGLVRLLPADHRRAAEGDWLVPGPPPP
jgi:hypothetical protein